MSSFARRFTTLAFLALPLFAGCGASNPYQGMEAEQLFLLGRQKYEEQDWADAIRALDRLLVSFGTWERTADARMLLAHSYFAKKDYLTARSEYQRFLDRFAGHDSAAVAASSAPTLPPSHSTRAAASGWMVSVSISTALVSFCRR